MHVKSLKVFCDIVGRRSFSRAADENGITQPGASQMVHQLEERLGVKLIDRSKRPFVLTPEGEVYYQGCREFVARYFALEERVKGLHEDARGRVQVASIYSIGLSWMKGFLQDFSQRYPESTVRLEYAHPDRVYEMVLNDVVDLGLVSYPHSSRTIEGFPWREERMVLVMAPAHPLSRLDTVPPEELRGAEMVGFDKNLKIRREIDRALAARDVSTDVVMEFDNIETLKRAIEINSGVSILPEPTVRREVAAGALATAPLEGMNLIRPVGVIHRRGKQLGETARRFMEVLRESSEKAGHGAAETVDWEANAKPDGANGEEPDTDWQVAHETS